MGPVRRICRIRFEQCTGFTDKAGAGGAMNKRRMDIINDLANLERTTTLSKLTEKYGVSMRTIRNDLAAINEILIEGGFTPVELRRGGEIHCALDFTKILDLIDVEDYYEYKLSREERVQEHHKLSKRCGHSSYEDLIEQGFLTEAVINFVASGNM